ncbi:CBS domain-containing protein [Falsiroseomonas oryzae]|uniref:CBS domain-containing protein n=1 Tax=Falsiroseomonas oryzae TaxID=2766473 RepID=UPI0022EA4993|nr:CBS domain-containing protein [Roseomonas sp. MO-31]
MVIAAILRRKGAEVVSVGPQDDVATIARMLAQHRIGAVLVRDAAQDVLGIVSERDIVRCIAAHGVQAVALPAARLMTRVLHTVGPETKVTEALEMMTDRRVRHLPVLDQDGNLAGMVSIGDLVKARIDEALHEAEELRHYVETAG